MKPLRLVAILVASVLQTVCWALEQPVDCFVREKEGKFFLVLRNMSANDVKVTTYRWAYKLSGWDKSGRQLTDEDGWMAKAELPSIGQMDWVVLRGKGAEYVLPVEFYKQSGTVAGASIARAVVSPRRQIDMKEPTWVATARIARAKITFREWRRG